jgi:acyl carrier protein
VIAAQADISSRVEVTHLIQAVETQAPPLAGVFHSAMTLDDALLVALDRERFEKVIRPKALGAWYLHEATRQHPLDLFVMFSSVAAIVGSPLQGNYVAANAFLDGLAHYRRSRSLPGLSINWGSISQVGVVARNPKLDQHPRHLGIQGLSPREVLELLAYFLQQQPVQICGLNIDWRRWLSSANVGAHGALYRSLFQSTFDQPEGPTQYSLVSKVQAVASEKRPEIVTDFLLDQIAKVTRISKSHLNTEARLNQLGLDSLMALELNSLIRLETDEEFPIGILKQTPSIQQLVELLLEKMTRGRG